MYHVNRIGLLFVFVACLGYGQVTGRRISFEPLAGDPVTTLGSDPVQAQRLARSGDVLYGLLYKRLAVRRILVRTGQAAEVTLDTFTEAQSPSFNILGDIDVGVDGSIYVPIVWREVDKSFHSGVAVWSPQGRHRQTIKLDPPVDIRHLAVDEAGSLFVLGMDPDYYKGFKPEHFLVHKYASGGKRLASFSQTSLRGPSAEPGDLHRALANEVDRGRLWIQDGALWQMQAITRGLRVFALDGSLLREIRFRPPDEAGSLTATASVWNIIKAGEDQFLVDWLIEETSPAAPSRSRGVVVHDAAGRPVSTMAGPLEGLDMPVACDSVGTCVVVRGGAGGQRAIARARLKVE